MAGDSIGAKARRAAGIVTMAAVAGLGLYYALRGLDWPVFRRQVGELDWRWLALAVAFDVASYLAQGLRWQLLLGKVSFWRTTRAIYAGLFLNEVIPLRPGEALRAWLAARDLRMGLRRIVPTMVTERLMDGFCLAVALLVAVRLAPISPHLERMISMAVPAIGLLGAVAWLLGRSNAPWAKSMAEGLRNRKALAVSACFLAAQGLAFWAVMRASHLPLGVLAGFVVMLAVRVGTMLPGAPANLGTHQVSTVLGLTLYGIPRAQAAGFSMIVFAILTIPLCLAGCGALLSAGLTWEQLGQSLQRRSIRSADGPGR